MINWNNLDTIPAYQELFKVAKVNLAEVQVKVRRYQYRFMPFFPCTTVQGFFVGVTPDEN